MHIPCTPAPVNVQTIYAYLGVLKCAFHCKMHTTWTYCCTFFGAAAVDLPDKRQRPLNSLSSWAMVKICYACRMIFSVETFICPLSMANDRKCNCYCQTFSVSLYPNDKSASFACRTLSILILVTLPSQLPCLMIYISSFSSLLSSSSSWSGWTFTVYCIPYSFIPLQLIMQFVI